MTRAETQVKTWAAGLGFDECRIARADEATHAEAFREWIDTGKHGDISGSQTNKQESSRHRIGGG